MKGSEDDETLLGIDADEDGVRDDLAEFVASLESDRDRRAALLSFARESTAMLLIGGDDDSTQAAAREQVQRVALTLGCVHTLYARQVEDGKELVDQIRYALYNNGPRLRAYSRASTLLSGTVLHATSGCNVAVTGVTP